MSSSVGCDQATKRLAEQTLSEFPLSFFFDTVRLQYIKNSGAFLGFGSQFSDGLKFWLFLALPMFFLLCAVIFVLFSKKLRPAQSLMISLVVSGGLGNLIDRIMLSGKVTDFINLGLGPVRTGIFNIADVSIMVGVVGLFLLELRNMRTKPLMNQ